MRPPPCFSVKRNCKLPTQRKALMAAATPLLKTRAAALTRPFKKLPSVENESSRPSRAAIAPPSMPTINVKFCTNALEPEMPE